MYFRLSSELGMAWHLLRFAGFSNDFPLTMICFGTGMNFCFSYVIAWGLFLKCSRAFEHGSLCWLPPFERVLTPVVPLFCKYCYLVKTKRKFSFVPYHVNGLGSFNDGIRHECFFDVIGVFVSKDSQVDTVVNFD
ncbi:hypothetical protein A2U01_0004190 [Trifolium medium]|uniref:Uncharacterized protein n=1 Tax=Trifolium medium TaxID=97028 RepID=A0A392M7U6_9FABA|nr:hypothetical protein [Trifolium medium]